METFDCLMGRRSVRSFTDEPVAREQLDQILTAGLVGPTGKGKKPWRFVVVQDRATLDKLVEARNPAQRVFTSAAAAIAVFGDESVSDTWVEDCSIAMQNMHLAAHDLGLGSVWIQGRLRNASEAQTTDAYVKELLGVDEALQLEAILALGHPQTQPAPHTKADIDTSYVTWK